jgi:sialic acid synthase SpsE
MKKNTNKTFIIAEAGVNHNGSLKKALKLIDVAASAGANAIKFQTFRAENLATDYAPKAEYQKYKSLKKETQFQMLKKLEFT